MCCIRIPRSRPSSYYTYDSSTDTDESEAPRAYVHPARSAMRTSGQVVNVSASSGKRPKRVRYHPKRVSTKCHCERASPIPYFAEEPVAAVPRHATHRHSSTTRSEKSSHSGSRSGGSSNGGHSTRRRRSERDGRVPPVSRDYYSG